MKTALLLLACFCLGLTGARADTLRLHDGQEFEGQWLSETDSAVTFEVQLAGGTILRTETFQKSAIAALIRMTPEEKLRWAREREFVPLQNYRLDPQASRELAYYDPVIRSFERFAKAHPNTPEANAVRAALAEWQAERDKVAAGMIKLDGQWMSRNELQATRLRARQVQLRQLAEAHFQAKRWAECVRTYQAFLGSAPPAIEVATARPQYAAAVEQWRAALEAETRAMDAKVAELERAAQATPRPGSLQDPASTKLGENSAERMRYMTAQVELTALRPKAADLQAQLAEANQLAQSLSQTAAAPPGSKAVPTEPTGDVLDATRSWWHKNWLILAGVALVGLWLLSRIVSR